MHNDFVDTAGCP